MIRSLSPGLLLVFLVWNLCSPRGVFAAVVVADRSPEAAFHEANAAYRAGDYPAAIAGYVEVVAAGVEDGHVLYDLGNALFREQRLGAAILMWRRAQVLLPRDPDLRANLERARSQVKDRLDPPVWIPALFFWQRTMALRESALLASSLVCLGFLVLLARRRVGRGVAGRSLVGVAVGVMVFGGLVALSTAYGWRALRARPIAVVLEEQVTARSTVGLGGVELFVLHEGAEVRVAEQDAEHVLVVLPDGRRGWCAAGGVGLVLPGSPLPPL